MTCIQELCASACLYTRRPGLFSRGGEHSGTCYHVQYGETKQGSRGLSCRREKYCSSNGHIALRWEVWHYIFSIKQSTLVSVTFCQSAMTTSWTRNLLVCMVPVTSWLCGRSPARGFHHCRSVCSAGASWGIGAWKRWAGRWCSREEACCYWSHCGSHCPCRPQRCLDPRLLTRGQRETGQSEGSRIG